MKTYPVPCTKEEMKRLLDAAMEDDFYYMLFMTAKTTGRRLGEYYKVQVKDIDFESGIMQTLVLKRKAQTKKEAILSEEVTRLIKQFVVRHSLKLDDYLFRKVSYRQIQNKVKYFAEKADIQHNVSFHNFRHYFITELSRQGWAHSKIAKLTGHSSVGTLAHYDHAVASDIKDDAVEALKNL